MHSQPQDPHPVLISDSPGRGEFNAAFSSTWAWRIIGGTSPGISGRAEKSGHPGSRASPGVMRSFKTPVTRGWPGGEQSLSLAALFYRTVRLIDGVIKKKKKKLRPRHWWNYCGEAGETRFMGGRLAILLLSRDGLVRDPRWHGHSVQLGATQLKLSSF